MSFRKHRENTEDWRMWIRLHRERLERCGVPEEAFRTKLDWAIFLDHGYVQPKDQRLDDWWRIGWLQSEEALNLRDFLAEEYGDAYAELMERLKQIADRGAA